MRKKDGLHMIKVTAIVVFNLICLFSIFYCLATTVEKRQAISEEVKVIKDFEVPKKAVEPRTSEVPAVPSVSPSPASSAQVQSNPKILVIDDFEGDETKNRIGSRANVYVKAPSKVMVAKRDDCVSGRNTKVLMIKYDKKNTGGPNGMGGWCGYYTLIKNEKTNQYLDGAGYNYITFWVKGATGNENFMVGLADEHWDKIGDSLKSEEIGVYLEKGKIGTQWQKAKVPLNAFFLDIANLSSITINFEADCFPEGAGAGAVFIDDIALEK